VDEMGPEPRETVRPLRVIGLRVNQKKSETYSSTRFSKPKLDSAHVLAGGEPENLIRKSQN